MDWFRKSELSSDRFSLLVTGDLETVQSVILRLAGGASSVKDELSTDEFRLQAKEFRETVEARKRGSIKDTIEYYTSSLMLQECDEHTPWPTIRFVEIEDWAKSRQYGLIAQGDLAEAERHPFQYLPETVATMVSAVQNSLTRRMSRSRSSVKRPPKQLACGRTGSRCDNSADRLTHRDAMHFGSLNGTVKLVSLPGRCQDRWSAGDLPQSIVKLHYTPPPAANARDVLTPSPGSRPFTTRTATPMAKITSRTTISDRLGR